MHLKFLVAATVIAGLGGCVTAPTNLTFSGRADEAMLIVAAPDLDALQKHVFRRVDLTTMTFVSGDIIVEVDNVKSGHSLLDGRTPNQINYGVQGRSVILAVNQLSPGHYVRVENLSIEAGIGSNTIRWLCMSEEAPVYDIRGGQISIIRTDEIIRPQYRPTDSKVLADYEHARESYPGLGSDAVIVAPEAIVHWTSVEPEYNFFSSPKRKCAEPPTFTFAATPPG